MLLQLFPECVARGDELYSHFEIDSKEISGNKWARIEDHKDTSLTESKTMQLNAKGEYSHKINPNSTLTLGRNFNMLEDAYANTTAYVI